MNYFGVSENDTPTARLINMENQKKFSIDSDTLTTEALLRLCQEVIDGAAKVTLVQKKHTTLHLHTFKVENVFAAALL